MRKMLRLFRFRNLLIAAVTQYLVQYLLLRPAFAEQGLSPALPGLPFALLVFDTVLIAAFGYAVNDLLDTVADQVNKPGRGAALPWANTRRITAGVLLAGLAIAMGLAGYVGQPGLVLIYPAACALLWWYSARLKHLPLAGNLVVSLFCALVIGIVLFAERENLAALAIVQPAAARRVWLLSGGYAWFAFMTTLLREIAKDAEDLEGDRLAGSRTISTAWGIPSARRWMLACAGLLLASLTAFAGWLRVIEMPIALFFCVAMVWAPCAWLLFLLPKAKQKKDFTRISLLAKLLMVSGLVLILLI